MALMVIARRVRIGVGLATITPPPPRTTAATTQTKYFLKCCNRSIFSSSRRGLSSSSSSSSLAASLAPVSPPFRPVDSRKGVCLVGAGRMGQIRAEGVMSNPGTFLASVVDTDEQKATALAASASAPAFW